MAYCTVDQIRALRPQHPISIESRPSQADVESLILTLQGDVDARVAALGYIVPVTGPISVAYLGAALAFGVAGMIEDGQVDHIAVTPEGEAGVIPPVTPRSNYTAKYEAMMALLDTRGSLLSDAEKESSEATAGARGRPLIDSFFVQNPDDDEDLGIQLTGSAKPRFSIRQEF